MARGSINHVALTVRDLSHSAEFYDRVLGFMGYMRVEVPESTQQSMKTQLYAWASPNGSITMRPAKPDAAGQLHDRNAAGLNHLAFNAENRGDVDRMHNLLREIGAQILDPPAEYPYFTGYYAVYFTDPDVLKSAAKIRTRT